MDYQENMISKKAKETPGRAQAWTIQESDIESMKYENTHYCHCFSVSFA